MNQPFRQLWITDPWDTLDHPLETTLRLMEAGLALGAEIYWNDVSTIALRDSQVTLSARKLLSVDPSRTADAFKWSIDEVRSPADFHQVHYRVDPPVDLHFLQPIGILELAAVQHPEIEWVNPLHTIAVESEKTAAAWFPDHFPKTLVTSEYAQAIEFLRLSPGAVVKPLHNAGSRGIFRAHTPSDLDALNWKRPGDLSGQLYLFQEFLPGILNGETRLWFADGELIGSVLKLPKKGDFRVLIGNGSEVRPVTPTPLQLTLARVIGAFLNRKKLRLAAVDLVGEKIIDFNFTSPGLIVEMERTLHQDLATQIQQRLSRRR